MREIIRRGCVSFAISSFCGILVNMIIDIAMNRRGMDGFVSMSPDYVALFPTPVIAAYVNVFLYGAIGAVFAMMTFIYDCERIGFLFQNAIYFAVTGAVCVSITILLWQLHHNPVALIVTLCGYGVTHIIMGGIAYKKLKSDIASINEDLSAS